LPYTTHILHIDSDVAVRSGPDISPVIPYPTAPKYGDEHVVIAVFWTLFAINTPQEKDQETLTVVKYHAMKPV
jgi:hypothetical protein